MTSFREDFGNQSFETGRVRWHARIGRANRTPLILNRVVFSQLEVGFVWPDGTAAVGDALPHIDRFERRASHSGTSGIQLPIMA